MNMGSNLESRRASESVDYYCHSSITLYNGEHRKDKNIVKNE